MELSRYFSIVIRHRWWALGALLVTLIATAFLTYSQASFYESSGTYVVRPRILDSSQAIRAIDTLARSGEINATFAAIAESGQVRDRATASLEPDADSEIIEVFADVLTGTNLIEIAVTGTDPAQVQALAVAIGAETVAYIDELGDVFQLSPLDAPDLPRRSAGPNRILNLTLGVILATTFAIVIAILAEKLHVPPA